LAAHGISNNSISSIRIFEPGWKIQLFNHGDFTGTSITVTVDTPSLADRGFDNQMSSMRITKVAIPQTGLVAYYPFKGNTRDLSGNGFHCTRHNAVLTFDRWGQPKNAYRFNGTTAFLECSDSPRLGVHVGVNMTVSAWVKPSKVNREPSNTQQIVSKYRYYVPETCDFHVGLNRNDIDIGPPTQIDVAGMGFDDVTGAPPRLNRWSHIAVVFRGTVGDARVYLDGNLVGTGPLTYNPVASPETMLIGSSHLAMGVEDDPYFGGGIDDVRIYERALTEAEIRRLARE
jgi:hypothetical protein